MSTYLTLFPLAGPEDLKKDWVHCKDALTFDQNYGIFSQLGDLSHLRTPERSDILERPTISSVELPKQLRISIGNERGTKRQDAFGSLKFVYARQLRRLKLPKDGSPKNRAVKAYAAALPGNTPIVLFWES